MLSFATEFPIDPAHTGEAFLVAVRDWIIGSPHTLFEPDDLVGLESKDKWEVRKSNELLETLRYEMTGVDSAAARYTKTEGGLEWVTTIAFSRSQPSSWVGVRISCESQHPAARLPPAKKPVFIETLINTLGGGIDGSLKMLATPHVLQGSDVELAARCITSQAGCSMPVVYVSAAFAGGHILDTAKLAHDLAGMAHVLVEPTRIFSRFLQRAADSQNVYGGTIGVYFPDGGGRRSFFIGEQYESRFDLGRAVAEEVRSALCNRRPTKASWASVQEPLARKASDALRQQGSAELNRYAEEFDKEIKSKNEELADAERDIARLEAEVRKYQAKSPMQGGLTLQTAPEQDLYAGELLDIVLDALKDATSRVVPDSRRQHVLQAIVNANSKVGDGSGIEGRLKTLLRDYRNMDSKVRTGLDGMGFIVSEDGKHYKIVFQGDDRYTFTMPKSGSDHRGGLNMVGDISRLLF